MGLHLGVDYSKLGTILDFAAFDNYPLSVSGNWPNISSGSIINAGLAASSMRCAKRDASNKCIPFYIMEEQDSNDGQASYYGNSYPEAIRLMAWQQVANGADGVQFFRWRTTRVGFEQHWEGILDWDSSTENAKYPMVQRVGSEFAKASAAVFGTRVRAQVALLLSSDTRFAFTEQGLTSPTFDVQPQLKALYESFKAHGQGVDIVYVPMEVSGASDMSGKGPEAPGFDLSGYKIVLAPTLWVVPGWLEAALRSYVANGGHLFLSMRSGSKNGANQYTSRTLPGPFADIAGIVVRQWDVSCGLGETSLQSSTATFAISQSQPRICDILLPNGTSTTVLATYADGYYAGKAALTRNMYGSSGGTVVYAGTVSDDNRFYDYAAAILAADAGLALTDRLPEGVEVSIRDAVVPQTGSAVFVLNYNSVPMTVSVAAAAGGVEVLSNTIINQAGVVNIGPWDVAVIAI
jgi:beta-galactosidase